MIRRETKKKYILFVIGSWLMARLHWTLETSRLAIFRVLPKAQIQHVIKVPRNHSITEWVFVEEDMRCFVWHRERDQHKIISLPPISKN